MNCGTSSEEVTTLITVSLQMYRTIFTSRVFFHLIAFATSTVYFFLLFCCVSSCVSATSIVRLLNLITFHRDDYTIKKVGKGETAVLEKHKYLFAWTFFVGMDPAEPYYQYCDPAVRLDPTDANFVDVIHTDGKSILLLGERFNHALCDATYYLFIDVPI